MKPIFILSDARTGSTLLRVLLDTHPAICSPGELLLGVLCEHLYYTIESTLGQAVVEHSPEAQAEFCLAETRRMVDSIMEKYCVLKGKRRWCEKRREIFARSRNCRACFRMDGSSAYTAIALTWSVHRSSTILAGEMRFGSTSTNMAPTPFQRSSNDGVIARIILWRSKGLPPGHRSA